jgi:hypothetical protein
MGTMPEFGSIHREIEAQYQKLSNALSEFWSALVVAHLLSILWKQFFGIAPGH